MLTGPWNFTIGTYFVVVPTLAHAEVRLNIRINSWWAHLQFSYIIHLLMIKIFTHKISKMIYYKNRTRG